MLQKLDGSTRVYLCMDDRCASFDVLEVDRFCRAIMSDIYNDSYTKFDFGQVPGILTAQTSPYLDILKCGRVEQSKHVRYNSDNVLLFNFTDLCSFSPVQPNFKHFFPYKA